METSTAGDHLIHYKAYMKNTDTPSIRDKLAGVLSFLPDQVFYQYKYAAAHHRLCNFARPTRFSEKIFHRMRYPSPLFSRMADKMAARSYIAEKAGSQYLVPLYHDCKRVTAATFSHLPDTFVMKSNHSVGQVRIVRDKSSEDPQALADLANGWLDAEFPMRMREKHYRAIPPSILFEQALLNDGKPPDDYKFSVFNPAGGAEPFVFIQYMRGRFDQLTQELFMADWTPAPFGLARQKCHRGPTPRPPRLDEMLDVARKLSAPLGYLRVDFYVHDDRVYVGELTVTPGAGRYKLDPPEWDVLLGERFGWPENPLPGNLPPTPAETTHISSVARTAE